MTSNQVQNLPAGAFLKRKTFAVAEPCYGMVLVPADPTYEVDDPGNYITVAWEQESHPFYNEFDFSFDEEYPEDKEEWRDPTRWLARRCLVYDEDHKTWWRNCKRVA